MKADAPTQDSADSASSLRMARVRHDLHNSIAHILGFSEMWLEEIQEKEVGRVVLNAPSQLKPGLQVIFRAAGQMMARINEDLGQAKLEAGATDLSSLQRALSEQTTQIVEATEELGHEPSALED